MIRFSLLIVLYSFLVSCQNEKVENKFKGKNYLQIDNNRIAAEWEPVKGVMFVWPPVISKELIIEFAKDTHIYLYVDGQEGEIEAKEWFKKWELDHQNITFINLKTNWEVTPRDWGPSAVFTNKGEVKITDGQYKYGSPSTDMVCNDSLEFHINSSTGKIYKSIHVDTAIVTIGNKIGLEVIDVPFANTGGNVLTDGLGTAFSTCALLTENRYNGVSNNEFFRLNDSILGLSTYHIISNFDEMGIQHIDCLLKLIDEETILVAEPPVDHKLYKIYDNIVKNELSNLKTVYNRPYTIHRIKTGVYYEDEEAAYLSAYTNSIILNKNVYVPLFGIKEDSLALKTWKSIMPGYTIKGFDYVLEDQPIKSKYHFEGFDELGVKTGWLYEDAIHCRTKAIWDENKILISVKKVLPEINVNQEAILYATIIDYGKEGLSTKEVFLNWRIKGQTNWNRITMDMDNNPNHWKAKFIEGSEGMEIEYYIEVKANTGETQTRPITAPKGYYEFKYVAQQSI
nr:agmatine deiminase family protein [Maribacter sp. MMG018]